jgi:hypothetical protein
MSQEDASVGATIASCYFLVNIYYVCFALITAILNLKLTVEYAVKFGNSPMVHELHRAQVIFISLVRMMVQYMRQHKLTPKGSSFINMGLHLAADGVRYQT